MPPAAGKKEEVSFFEALYATNNADAHQICDGLFLGAASAAEDKKAMQKRQISHVLVVHPALPEKHPELFVYKRLPLIDEPSGNLLELLPPALGFLAKARAEGGKTFVYCKKGISRSSSVVIALLMIERGISFSEAFDLCETKRKVVYPNVGFQQQLRYLESLLSGLPADATWEVRLDRMKEACTRSHLEKFCLTDRIDKEVYAGLDAVEDLAQKVLMQPTLLQNQELWKRHGLFFENLERYKTRPGDAKLFERAKATAERLKALPKVFSDTLKGVKLGLAVAKELETWAKLGSQPALATPAGATTANPFRSEPSSTDMPPPSGIPSWVLNRDAMKRGEQDSDEDDPMAKKGKKDKKKDKKDKKADKEDKKAAKEEEKMNKAEKKLQKKLAKIEKQAHAAEMAAKEEHKAAEAAAQRAEEFAAKMDALDAEEEEAKEKQKRAREQRQRSRSRSR